jgi:ABC-type transport system involved in cytochrome bd biosynthesis fused ATPase/permease subunit
VYKRQGSTPTSFLVEPGTIVEVALPDQDAQHLSDALFGFGRPKQGRIQLGELGLREFPTTELRKRITLVRRAEVMPGTILENLRIANSGLSREKAWKLIEAVALRERLRRDEAGLDLRIDSDMSQLTNTQMMQVTLARALAAGPDIIILDRSLDGIPRQDRALLLASLSRWETLGILILTGRPELAAPRVSVTSTRPALPTEKF